MTVTTPGVERSFNKLKIEHQRSTIDQSRLSSVTLLSIENKVAKPQFK